MTELLELENGDNQTSRPEPSGPGIFRPGPTGKVRRIKMDGIQPSVNMRRGDDTLALELAHQLGETLGRAEEALIRAIGTREELELEDSELEVIISDLEDAQGTLIHTKNLSKEQVESLERKVSQNIEALKNINLEISKAKEIALGERNNLEKRSDEQTKQLEKYKILTSLVVHYSLAQSTFTSLKNSQLSLPEKDELLTLFTSYDWLADSQAVEKNSREKSFDELEELEITLTSLSRKIADLSTFALLKENEEKTLKILTDLQEIKLTAFENTLHEVSTLTIINEELRALLTKSKQDVQSAKEVLNASLSSDTLSRFIEKLTIYEEKVEEVKKSLLVKVIPPAFLGRVTSQELESKEIPTDSEEFPKIDTEQEPPQLKNTPTIPRGGKTVLRRQISGSEPSALQEKKGFEKTLASLKVILNATDALLNQNLENFTDKDEKNDFQRVLKEVNKLLDETSTSPTKETVAQIKSNVEVYQNALREKIASFEPVPQEQTTLSPFLEEGASPQAVSDIFTNDPELRKHFYNSDRSVNKPPVQYDQLLTPTQNLQKLIERKTELEKEWEGILHDQIGGIAFGAPELVKKELEKEIVETTLQIKEATNAILDNFPFVTKEGATAHHTPSDLKIPEVSLDPGTAKVEIVPASKHIQLPEEASPVVTALEPVTAQPFPEPSSEKIVTSPTISSHDLQEKTEVLEGEKKLTSSLEQNGSQERFTAVNSLAAKLFTYPSVKKISWGLLAAGMPRVHIYNDQKTNTSPEGRVKTFGDVVLKDSQWEKVVEGKVPKTFLEGFTGPNKISFEEFLKKNAPSFGINPYNPAAKDKLANLMCSDVYGIPGANAGVNPGEQREASLLIKNLNEVLKAAQDSMNIFNKKDDDIFENMTIKELYDATQKAVADATTRRGRLQAN